MSRTIVREAFDVSMNVLSRELQQTVCAIGQGPYLFDPCVECISFKILYACRRSPFERCDLVGVCQSL